MSDGISVRAVNFEELQAAFNEAPALALRYTRSEMGRFGKRFRKKFIRAYLKGTPGIKWDESKKKIGKNVRADVTGQFRLEDLTLTMAISRILRKHEEGGEIVPTGGRKALVIPMREGLPAKPRVVKGLFRIPGTPLLAIKSGGDGMKVLYVLVRKIRMKKRLDFRGMVDREVESDLRPRLLNALSRSVRVAMEQRLKANVARIASFGERMAALG